MKRTLGEGFQRMTEAELVATFQGFLTQIQTILFGYISFISGFLVMSYLAADKLSRLLSALVLGLFSVACGALIFRLFLVRHDFFMLYEYILQNAQSGALNLPWFGTNPRWAPRLLTILDIAISMGGFAGSVAFFFIQRRGPGSKAPSGLE